MTVVVEPGGVGGSAGVVAEVGRRVGRLGGATNRPPVLRDQALQTKMPHGRHRGMSANHDDLLVSGWES
jgi:hypothetical protein